MPADTTPTWDAQELRQRAAVLLPRNLDIWPIQVVTRHPHDTEAFTQGLVWDANTGALYESTGLYGRSQIRKVDLTTGEVFKQRSLPDHLFGEGLALHDGMLWQLTWQEGQLLRWHNETLEPDQTMQYTGQGWGLAHDGQRWLMSDGTSRLQFRDLASFQTIGWLDVRVMIGGTEQPVRGLNELEVIGRCLLANLWPTTDVLVIDLVTEVAVGRLDLMPLAAEQTHATADVANGMAYHDETGHVLMTGKRWAWVYEVALPQEQMAFCLSNG